MREHRLKEDDTAKPPRKRVRLAKASVNAENVPDKIDGELPPLQKTSNGVPYSRRREFGVRAIQVNHD